MRRQLNLGHAIKATTINRALRRLGNRVSVSVVRHDAVMRHAGTTKKSWPPMLPSTTAADTATT